MKSKFVIIYLFIRWTFSAYVSGERGGLILENPYQMGESLNGATGLNIDDEVKLVEEKLKELQSQKSSPSETTLAMKDFGHERYYFLF